MTNLPLFPDEMPKSDDTPLPLIVAKRWNFPLAHIQTEDGIYYAIQDWMRGLTGENDTRKMWNYFKKQAVWQQMSRSTRRMPYLTSNGKKQQRDYATDKGLYLVAQYLRITEARPTLDAIRRYLAAAGAFVDEVRREPDKLVEGVSNPDKLLDAFIEYHANAAKMTDGFKCASTAKSNATNLQQRLRNLYVMCSRRAILL